jgi:hypothetical protein
MDIRVAFNRTSRSGIESSLIEKPKQVTPDRRCSFSYHQKEDGTVHVYAGALARRDCNPRRVREIEEMVEALLKEGEENGKL